MSTNPKERPAPDAPVRKNPEAPITVTEKAARAIEEKAAKENAAGQLFRIRVLGGGCSGATYRMLFEPGPPGPIDYVTTQHGVTVVIDPKSLNLVTGSTLDYKADLMQQRFVWNNPNAKSTCGCGESFGI